MVWWRYWQKSQYTQTREERLERCITKHWKKEKDEVIADHGKHRLSYNPRTKEFNCHRCTVSIQRYKYPFGELLPDWFTEPTHRQMEKQKIQNIKDGIDNLRETS